MAEQGVTIHIFRHGEKQGDALTSKGEHQALEAGEKLRDLVPENAILKMYSSPAMRTQQTRAFITQGLGRGVYHPRLRAAIGLPTMNKEKSDALIKTMGQEKFVEDWLEGKFGPDVFEPAGKVAERLAKQSLGFARKVAERSKGARPIHLVYVTHQGGIDKLAMQLIGKAKVSELGGLSKELERLTVHIPQTGHTMSVEYRGHRYTVPREMAPRRGK